MTLVLLPETIFLFLRETSSPVLCIRSCSPAQPWPGKGTRRRIITTAAEHRVLSPACSGKTLKLDEFKTSPEEGRWSLLLRLCTGTLGLDLGFTHRCC